MSKSSTEQLESKHLRNSMFFSLLFCALIVFIHILPIKGCHGIYPREFTKLWGLLTSTFLHANWQHLWSNIGPLYLFMAGLFYYFPNRVLIVTAAGIILVNISVWISGHAGCHIGASGLIYFFAAYLVTMAFFKRQRNLAAFTLIIVFLYGSMIWGIFPTKENISWESHLFGALWGIVAGIYFKKDKVWADTPEPTPKKDNQDIDESELKIINNEEYIYYNNHSTTSMFKTSTDIDNWLNYKEIKYNFEESESSKTDKTNNNSNGQ
ncbi:MAG: rhomboid family intramembrane serine protease [Salinivirgaceae bacterium]|jgi:membrane associated rhomboid family serine protease|nr:rhomboid family intramembrane serine protease [Bacteroidales bacterium]